MWFSPPPMPVTPSASCAVFRSRRRGAWSSSAGYLAAGNSSDGYPAFEFVVIGFRVASIPEPSTALLVLARLGSLALRHRRRG